MFTLYYAQGGQITTTEKFDLACDDYKEYKTIDELAIDNNNVASNLLDSANHANTEVKQTTNDIAVGASNVQIATNAIVTLASDLGSIYNIVNAADYKSAIYDLAYDANTYMGDTAYSAEVASQIAMESSLLTAKVTSDTLAQEAEALSTAFTTLQESINAQFLVKEETMTAISQELDNDINVEKKAEGQLELINAEYFCIRVGILYE